MSEQNLDHTNIDVLLEQVRGGKGLTQGEQPLGGRGSDTEPKCRVDPNDGCASGDERD
jgi:hypothetical protein